MFINNLDGKARKAQRRSDAELNATTERPANVPITIVTLTARYLVGRTSPIPAQGGYLLLRHYKMGPSVLVITGFILLPAKRTFFAKTDGLNLIWG